jgi:hypothetical protein
MWIVQRCCLLHSPPSFNRPSGLSLSALVPFTLRASPLRLLRGLTVAKWLRECNHRKMQAARSTTAGASGGVCATEASQQQVRNSAGECRICIGGGGAVDCPKGQTVTGDCHYARAVRCPSAREDDPKTELVQLTSRGRRGLCNNDCTSSSVRGWNSLNSTCCNVGWASCARTFLLL